MSKNLIAFWEGLAKKNDPITPRSTRRFEPRNANAQSNTSLPDTGINKPTVSPVPSSEQTRKEGVPVRKKTVFGMVSVFEKKNEKSAEPFTNKQRSKTTIDFSGFEQKKTVTTPSFYRQTNKEEIQPKIHTTFPKKENEPKPKIEISKPDSSKSAFANRLQMFQNFNPMAPPRPSFSNRPTPRKTFQEVTNCSSQETARKFLAAAKNNVDNAVLAYFREMESDPQNSIETKTTKKQDEELKMLQKIEEIRNFAEKTKEEVEKITPETATMRQLRIHEEVLLQKVIFLDGLKCEGDVRLQRKNLINYIEKIFSKIDSLKKYAKE